MDVLVRLTIPNYIYRFYRDASLYVADSSPEDIMADALSNYAVMLSEDIARAHTEETADDEK